MKNAVAEDTCVICFKSRLQSKEPLLPWSMPYYTANHLCSSESSLQQVFQHSPKTAVNVKRCRQTISRNGKKSMIIAHQWILDSGIGHFLIFVWRLFSLFKVLFCQELTSTKIPKLNACKIFCNTIFWCASSVITSTWNGDTSVKQRFSPQCTILKSYQGIFHFRSVATQWIWN